MELTKSSKKFEIDFIRYSTGATFKNSAEIVQHALLLLKKRGLEILDVRDSIILKYPSKEYHCIIILAIMDYFSK